VMLELTPQRLDQVIKGLRARRAVLDGRNGAPSVGALVSRRDAARKDASELRDKSGDAIAAYQSRESEVRQCREEAFRDKQSAREAANRDRAMSDPDFMMKLAELSQRLSEAQARGDTAAVRRLTEEFQNTYAAPTKADSVAVDRQCGRPPAPPPALARLDSLQALEARFTEQLRQREMEADTVGVQGSGLTAQQQAMAMERAEMYLSQSSAEVTYRGFTKVELDALHARRAELAELL